MKLTRVALACLATLFCVALLGAGPAAADKDFSQYRIESATSSLTSTQAGAHADFTFAFELSATEEAKPKPYAFTRDIVVKLPAGLIGNPQAFPQCTLEQFGPKPEESKCPQDAQVGVGRITLAGTVNGTVNEPIYNMQAPGGDVAARFGLFAGIYPTLIDVRLDPADNRLVASVKGASAAAELIAAETTFWGVPADPVHDELRLTPQEGIERTLPPGGRKSNQPKVPFLSNPTECGSGKQVELSLVSYQRPEETKSAPAPFPQIGGCELLEFSPQASLRPTTTQASSPSGLEFELSQSTKGLEFPNLNVGSYLKRAEVILPEGVTVNPSQAEGIGVCTEADLARETYDGPPDQGCPQTSKIGSVEATTPVIDRDPRGSLYLAKPYENRFGSLLALYMVLKIPDRGVLVRLAGEVSADPETGRLTTVFDEIPQQPVSSVALRLREGARAPLVTPPSCGAHQAIANFTPWSSPGKALTRTSTFVIESGPNHGPCPTGGLPPFGPALVAGTLNNAAGSFSPFNVKLTRNDGEQEITNFSIKLPPGVAAKLTGVPFCPDAAIARAAARTGPHGGLEELQSPSCPQTSEVGRTLGGAGVGQVLAYAPGKLYLAGPYKGAPVSMVAITSGVVGPFDIGTIVVRLAIKVNPETGEVFLDATGSDPIPHIVKGVVLHLRDIRAYTDRPSFTFNPTSCEPTSTSATVLGSGLDFTSALDDNPFVSTSRFQAADCAALPFKPKLSLSLIGQKKRAGNPALRAHLEMGGMNATGAAESGLAYSRVALPKTLFLDNAHIGTVCTRVQFRSGAKEGENCPAASIIGSAKAVTPILDEPLAGPIYLRSNPERELPDIAASLQGRKISVVAVGHTDSAKGGGLRNTFEVIPDAPIDSVDINLFGGKRGLIESSRNLCSYKPAAKVEFRGHNGKARNYPKLRLKVPGCGKKAKGKKAKR